MEQLGTLVDALLDFQGLTTWLARQPPHHL